jgi:hypothetical protein
MAPSGEPLIRVQGKSSPCRLLLRQVGGGGDMGGHVLRETTSQGLCGLRCPSRTSEANEEQFKHTHGFTAGPSTKLLAWGGVIWEDMCYQRRRAEACVDEAAPHELVNRGCVCVTAGLCVCVCVYYCRT